jgi:hypothetical protein
MYGAKDGIEKASEEDLAFDHYCLDHYCSHIKQEQEAVVMFLLCWNRAVGVKGPGQMIALMIWEGREEGLLKLPTLSKRAKEKKGCILF